MSRLSSSFAVAVALLSTAAVLKVTAQQGTFPATPLASKHFSYPSGLPQQVDTDADLIRGPQSGYNRCDSTTEGQTSKCQNSFLNSLDDFCLWAPMNPNSTIADTEGEEVAWCTKPGRGTRLIPADYVQVVGFIEQTLINIQDGDYGGELDLRGNPLGGVVFSTAFGNDNNTYTQVIEWHNFMGGGAFCFKACDPAGPNAAKFCQHIYDRIGCEYNAPNNAQTGIFESCLGDNQDFPGVYTLNDTSGTVTTYSQVLRQLVAFIRFRYFWQPPESLGVITSMPYTAKVPASSSCTSFGSDAVYTALASVSSAASTTATASGENSALARATSTRASTSASASSTGTSDAESRTVTILATLLSTLFAAVFLS
ncbi:manno protein [Mycena amicta]|nr:manno protein [Mycena amicta]